MGILDNLTHKVKVGRADDVDYVIYHLTNKPSIVLTRFVDYALGLVENPVGVNRIKHHLFNGTKFKEIIVLYILIDLVLGEL